ncbi:plant UBX domain-containing protein 1 [Prunus yedoensis var. nudiflora]|uniref:Plant UBX domain-containing protein 1 n=1 Tax=Prunus yedoensis var. nudiflora TaxID=2094558 RepID=A0A314XQ31_PRUYE|nr:plant UBX domain-containing protein 1 [Prunus yedoensis var. nudiflora]
MKYSQWRHSSLSLWGCPSGVTAKESQCLIFVMSCPADDSSDAKSGPFLQEGIMSLKGLELLTKHAEPVESAPEMIPEASSHLLLFKRRSLQRKYLLSQSG